MGVSLPGWVFIGTPGPPAMCCVTARGAGRLKWTHSRNVRCIAGCRDLWYVSKLFVDAPMPAAEVPPTTPLPSAELHRAIAHIALLHTTSLIEVFAPDKRALEAEVGAAAEKESVAAAAAQAAEKQVEAAASQLIVLHESLHRVTGVPLALDGHKALEAQALRTAMEPTSKAMDALYAAVAAYQAAYNVAKIARGAASQAAEALEDQQMRAAEFSDTVKDICDASSWAAGVMGPDGVKELEPLVMWAFKYINRLPYEHQIEAFKQAATEQKPSNECLSELVKFHARELNGSSVAALSLIMSSYISKTLLWPTRQ